MDIAEDDTVNTQASDHRWDHMKNDDTGSNDSHDSFDREEDADEFFKHKEEEAREQ